ncbi:uncharacterized protein [Macrobrachium rosenbergii]|uniref:uncharacterized protein n=1 Tax=Macrobrachium rosenbergii TaxID=79674 RepID=UPI0034D42BB3
MAHSPLPAKPLEWTRTNTLHFIELLKEHPSVWNIKCKQYKMRNIRSVSLETIKSDLSSFVNCTLQNKDITKKLHTLKTQFYREMSAIKESQNSGAGKGDLYTPKLWCFDELRFLLDGEARASTSNLDEGETNTAQLQHSEENFTSQTVSPLPSIHQELMASEKKGSQQSESSLDISKFVDTELKNMSEMQQKLAKKLTCLVLHMGGMGDLARDHKVVRVDAAEKERDQLAKEEQDRKDNERKEEQARLDKLAREEQEGKDKKKEQARLDRLAKEEQDRKDRIEREEKQQAHELLMAQTSTTNSSPAHPHSLRVIPL